MDKWALLVSDEMVSLDEAVRVLRMGGLIAYPTETFYGLGVLVSRSGALERLWRLKDREHGGPISLLIPWAETTLDLALAGAVPEVAFRRLVARFWPGPLTIVVTAREGLDPRLVGRDGGVAVRLSSHPTAAGLVRLLREPLTATSANYRGEPPPRTPEEIRASGLAADLDLILEAGQTAGVLPSTVLRLEKGRASVLRDGAIPRRQLVEALRGVPIEWS